MQFVAMIQAVASAITELITLGWKIAALWKEAQTKKWVTDGRKLSVVISEAKTDEERKALAKALFNHTYGK